ncbi:MAG TPA: alpha/beta hydrolase [Burkholderiales bacterium]|nr:alpha/beta hydrolase [Burkholderiales bacterium]
MMKYRYNTVRVGDIDIHYELADYTPPWRETLPETILLYHGYARNMLFWQNWVPLLAGDYRVLRFDARGCGGTTQPPDGSVYSFEQLAGDAMGLMDALGIDRVHWVGESSGGIVGMTAALNHPQRLHTLTLCDTPFKRSAQIASTYTLGEATRAAAFDKFGVGGWCRQTLSYRIDTAKASPALCEWYIAQMDATPKHVANGMDKAVAQGDLWPRLPDIQTPTLILGGDRSLIADESHRSAMRERMPHAKVVAFEGYGHGIHLLAPERCVAEIRSFVRDIK